MAQPVLQPAEPPTTRPPRPNRLARVKRIVVGEPLPTDRLVHERLGKPTALAVFASDNLSSSAYATEEILRVLLVSGLGAVAFARVVPITIALLGVLGVLLFSYRQTIKAYPQAGGAYLVTRDNFGVLPAQVAGVALLTDYILTVSVSVAAGTAALTSLQPSLYPFRVYIACAFIAIIAFGNLRGVKESGRIFAVPTYFFIVMTFLLLGLGMFKLVTGTLPEHGSPFPIPELQEHVGFAYVFLLLKAFASGGAAVTGVEAISNGVPAFRPPEWRNAITTLMWMGGTLGTMFLGLSILAMKMHISVDESEQVTVIAQIAKAVFGGGGLGGALFAMMQIATLLILVLAANTSFADFPRLASFHAGDRFLPRQLTRYGDRLVFSNGIIVLALCAIVPVIAFQASVTRLIPLYAIGVFTSFTFSQLGMAKHHLTGREPGWRLGLAINGFGGLVSFLMTIIIAVVKFTGGAWMILVAVPVLLAGLLAVNRHYKTAGEELRDPSRLGPIADAPRQHVIVHVGTPGAEDVYAAAYASRAFAADVRLVLFARFGQPLEDAIARWTKLDLELDILPIEHDEATSLVNYVRERRNELGPYEIINVVIPETVTGRRFGYLLRSYRTQRLKAKLVKLGDVIVTNVAHHPTHAELEPISGDGTARSAVEGWHHVAVVLVSGVHNGTVKSLRHARSLRADEVHALTVSIDDDETETLLADWQGWHDRVPAGWNPSDRRMPLEVLESPYREISGPLHAWVRERLAERPKTFMTIILPEFVVQKRWHAILHNQTALTIKAEFLFEPSVVVASVPYELTR